VVVAPDFEVIEGGSGVVDLSSKLSYRVGFEDDRSREVDSVDFVEVGFFITVHADDVPGAAHEGRLLDAVLTPMRARPTAPSTVVPDPFLSSWYLREETRAW